MRMGMVTLGVAWVVAGQATAHADDDAPTPTARATALVTAQLAAVDQPSAMLATLAPDAIILGNGAVAVASDPGAAGVLATLGRSSTGLPVLQASIARLDVGATADAVWIHADVTLFHTLRGGRSGNVVTHARLSELVVADGARWKTLAIGFTSSAGTAAAVDTLPPPSPGPLGDLLDEPSRLDDALLDDDSTIALGPYELARGASAARTVIQRWRDGDVHLVTALEVRAKGWGYVAGELTVESKAWWEPVVHLRVLMFAVPDAGGQWRVVSLHAM